MNERKLLRIIGGAVKGDKESFNELVRVKSRNILYIALKMMGDKQEKAAPRWPAPSNAHPSFPEGV